MRSRELLTILAVVVATGCTTGIALTDRGSHVTTVSSVDLPPGCRLLSDVAIGIPPDAARPRTEEQLVMLMRNKAGEIGGTHVLIEQSEARGEAWVGRGRAYACPETEPPTVSAASAGGEDEASEDEASGEDEETADE